MTPRRKRLAIIVGLLVGVAAIAALVLNAFRSNLVFFYSPTQVAAHEAPQGRTFRIGGMVVKGSLQREGIDCRFTVTDLAQSMVVRYHGLLPDLFKEGKGVVAQGRLGADGVFEAQEVLAKHDENYMPPEAAAALKQAAQHGGSMKADRAEKATGTTAGTPASTPTEPATETKR